MDAGVSQGRRARGGPEQPLEAGDPHGVAKTKMGGIGQGEDFPAATHISLEIIRHFTILKEL